MLILALFNIYHVCNSFAWQEQFLYTDLLTWAVHLKNNGIALILSRSWGQTHTFMQRYKSQWSSLSLLISPKAELESCGALFTQNPMSCKLHFPLLNSQVRVGAYVAHMLLIVPKAPYPCSPFLSFFFFQTVYNWNVNSCNIFFFLSHHCSLTLLLIIIITFTQTGWNITALEEPFLRIFTMSY